MGGAVLPSVGEYRRSWELLAGRSKGMPEPHSIGVGLWPYGHISKYPRAVMVDVETVR